MTCLSKLLDINDDALIVVLNNCTLRELITLRKTCKRFYALISKLPRYKKGIKELEELYTSGILAERCNEVFLITLWQKNYSNLVLESINFRFHSITRLDFMMISMFWKKGVIYNKILIFISHWCKMLHHLDFSNCTDLTDVSCLGQCKMLKDLDLRGCNRLTDVSELTECKNLWHINLECCWGLSKKNIYFLRKKLPNCSIECASLNIINNVKIINNNSD